jgi:SAM-dependent methyltransferase
LKDPLGDLLHEQRARLLRQLPRGAPVFCSVGCAGTWYFHWIEQNCGPVGRHIGLELYAPKPDDLPPNVEWIANSASDMRDVASASVDVLFSGQNVEHLFLEQVKGFFREANRVLRPGGALCVDSPNRQMTLPLGFNFPEHTFEFNVDEAVTLMRLAGFEIETVDGIWGCADPRLGLLPLNPEQDTPEAVERRKAEAGARPKDSALWWVVGRKTGPVSAQFEREVDRMFAREFPSFSRGRLVQGSGKVRHATGTEVILEITPDDGGMVFFGPYIALAEGDYRAEFLIRPLAAGGEVIFDVVSEFSRTVHAATNLQLEGATDGWLSVPMRFQVPYYARALETRCRSRGAHALVRFGGQVMPWA